MAKFSTVCIAFAGLAFSEALLVKHVKEHDYTKDRSLLQQDTVPGAGIHKFEAFKTVLKDRFTRGVQNCVKDYMYYHGDKFGDNKQDYKLGNVSNVAIVHYDAHVAKEDRKPMTQQVCFEFCRTIPNMNFFGLVDGHNCYCTPYFKAMESDSSMCLSSCPGDSTLMCGGKSKSSVFSMHACAINLATPPNGDTILKAADFSGGTYRITTPGKYVLDQDVEFEPSGDGVTETLYPDKDSKHYNQLAGYFLGFFAALTVEADDVEIDCMGHEIKMSEKFHRFQRFFSIIQLGSKPFIAGQGPPQFASDVTSPGPVKVANNVTILNCKLGLSSHHGIHGNNNEGVTLRDVVVKDFEVAGIALNGASKVVIENADIGPSLTNTFGAALSQAIFLDHLANSLLPTHVELNNYALTTPVTLRGQTSMVEALFKRLRKELRAFLQNPSAEPKEGDLADIFGQGSVLPDGSAIYGLLLTEKGVAIADFGAGCGIGENPAHLMVGPITLKNIHIHDLKLAADQITRTVIGDGPQLMGPAGDVLPITRLWDMETYAYVGNTLSDAQVAMAVLKDAASAGRAEQPGTWTEAKYFFGAVNIPAAIQTWAAGSLSESQAKAWKDSLVQDGSFKCDGDAMSHHNKGVVGLRLEFQELADVSNVRIENLSNVGKHDAKYCTAPHYKGGDVRGVSVRHTKHFEKSGVSVDDASLEAPHGNVMSISMLQLRRAPTAMVGGMLADDI